MERDARGPTITRTKTLDNKLIGTFFFLLKQVSVSDKVIALLVWIQYNLNVLIKRLTNQIGEAPPPRIAMPKTTHLKLNVDIVPKNERECSICHIRMILLAV